MDEYDILSYGISMTTLEEVFLKCNKELSASAVVREDAKKSSLYFSQHLAETVKQTA